MRLDPRKHAAPTLQRVRDERARLLPLEARASELRAAIARETAEVADLDAAIRRPQEVNTREAVRDLALGGAPLDNVATPDFLNGGRRAALQRQRAQVEERRQVLEAALRENMLEQGAVGKAIDAAKAAHFKDTFDAVFASEAMMECRRALVGLYGAACASGNSTRWWDWLAVAVTGWERPTDAEHEAAVRRFAGE